MPKKRGCSLGTPAFGAMPLRRKKPPHDGQGLPRLVVAITTKRFWCERSQEKGAGLWGALAALTGAAL